MGIRWSVLICVILFTVSSLRADDEERLINAICDAHKANIDVNTKVADFSKIKLYAFIDGAERKKDGELSYIEVKATTSKFQQQVAKFLAPKYKISILFRTQDETYLRPRPGSKITVAGEVESILFFAEKLQKPSEVNYSEVVVNDETAASFFAKKAEKAARLLAQKERARVGAAKLEHALAGKKCAVVVSSATINRFDIMEIEGFVWFPSPIEADSMSIQFGTYLNSAQTGTAIAFITAFSGNTWAFCARSTGNARDFELRELRVGWKKYDRQDILFMTKNQLDEYLGK